MSRGLGIGILAGALLLGAGGSVASAAPPPAPEAPAPALEAPIRRRPPIRRGPTKPSAPVDLELVVVSGGNPGEVARLLLWAEPASPGGRLDLGVRLPEGLRVVSGTTSESAPSDGGSRLVEVEVEVPEDGVHRVLGTARWTLPGGQVWTRAVTLILPLGTPPPRKPELTLTPVPGGGFRVELQGSAP